jgi:hypothetical protein
MCIYVCRNYRYVFSEKQDILRHIEECKLDDEPFRLVTSEGKTWALFKTDFTNDQQVVMRLLSKLNIHCDIDAFMHQVSRLSAECWYSAAMTQLIRDLPETYWQE